MRPGITASSTRSSSITSAFRAVSAETVALSVATVALLVTLAGAVPAGSRAAAVTGSSTAAVIESSAAEAGELPALVAGGSGSSRFRLVSGSVAPGEAVPGSIRPVRLVYRFRARRATGVAIRVIRAGRGKTVRRFRTSAKLPGRWYRQSWNGLTRRGRPVPAGRYRIAIGPSGGPLRTLGYLRFHDHTFPVDAAHGVRGAVGVFGAARLGGRTHEGFDVTAACGSPLVAVRSGEILKTAYDTRYLGNYVVLKGAGERRTYLYAHLLRPPAVSAGQPVRAGRRLGAVGQTGNAGGTPCHLHIEVRSRGRLLDPWPFLSAADW